MRFIDSNCIVFAFTENAHKFECREIIESEDLVTNTLVLTEIYAILVNIVNKEYAAKIIKQLLQIENLRIIYLDANLIFESIKRQDKYNLKINDLIHYTTALLANCLAIYSYDKDFDGYEIKRIGP